MYIHVAGHMLFFTLLFSDSFTYIVVCTTLVFASCRSACRKSRTANRAESANLLSFGCIVYWSNFKTEGYVNLRRRRKNEKKTGIGEVAEAKYYT